MYNSEGLKDFISSTKLGFYQNLVWMMGSRSLLFNAIIHFIMPVMLKLR